VEWLGAACAFNGTLGLPAEDPIHSKCPQLSICARPESTRHLGLTHLNEEVVPLPRTERGPTAHKNKRKRRNRWSHESLTCDGRCARIDSPLLLPAASRDSDRVLPMHFDLRL
jgi:hypothetical protein